MYLLTQLGRQLNRIGDRRQVLCLQTLLFQAPSPRSPVRARQRSDTWPEPSWEGGTEGTHDHPANADCFLQENGATDFSRFWSGHRPLDHMGNRQCVPKAFKRAHSVGTMGKKMKCESSAHGHRETSTPPIHEGSIYKIKPWVPTLASPVYEIQRRLLIFVPWQA